MSVGSLIFVISFFGCCGALRESSWMILTFSVFLTLVFVTEIGIGVAGYIKHGELPGILEKQFNKTMEDYTNSVEAQHAWSLVQGELECCGIHGPTDWRPIFKNKTVPAMCCHILPEGVKHCTTDVSIILNILRRLITPSIFSVRIKSWLPAQAASISGKQIIVSRCCRNRNRSSSTYWCEALTFWTFE